MLLYGPLPSFHDIMKPLKALLMEHLAECHHPPELQVRLPGHKGLLPWLGCFYEWRAGWWVFLSLRLLPKKFRTPSLENTNTNGKMRTVGK